MGLSVSMSIPFDPNYVNIFLRYSGVDAPIPRGIIARKYTNGENMRELLVWDSSYAIALALKERFPTEDLENVSLNMVYEWVLSLSDFDDDPALANDEILMAIYQDWLEEILA